VLTAKQPTGSVFEYSLLEERSGFISVIFEGQGARRLFAHEAGGHRWQRIPPTEKRGRVHTSTITVAVLNPDQPPELVLKPQDVQLTATTGTGPGGQHRNKTQSCIVATHKETGIKVRIDHRSQKQSKALALRILAERVLESKQARQQSSRAAKRKKQVGSGMRSDKVITLYVHRDRVVHHTTNKSTTYKRYSRGFIGDLQK
jgi:peptide chain release factor 1